MRVFLTLFMVMVSACGTMEGDVNVSDDSVKDKLKNETSESEEKLPEESKDEAKNENETETETKPNQQEEIVDSNSINNNDDPDVEVNVNVNVDVDTSKEDGDPERTGKLYRGMTKAEVLEVFPEPTHIENQYWDRWIYENNYELCTDSIYDDCRLQFKNGLLDSVERVKSEHLDITSF